MKATSGAAGLPNSVRGPATIAGRLLGASFALLLALLLIPSAGLAASSPAERSTPGPLAPYRIDAANPSVKGLASTVYVNGLWSTAAWPATFPATFDPSVGTLLATGASVDGPDGPATGELLELGSTGWQLFPSAWDEPDPAAEPVYDGSSQSLLLTGPVVESDFELDLEGLWTLHGSTWSYNGNRTTSPPPLGDPAVVYDPAFGGVLVFGGSIADNSTAWDSSRQLWLEHGGNWSNLDQQFPFRPGDRWGASFVYDPTTDLAYLFGGIGDSVPNGTWQPVLDETWALSSNGWENLTSTLPLPPPLLNGGAVAYDSSLPGLVAVGPARPYPEYAQVWYDNGTVGTEPLGSTIMWELGPNGWVNITQGPGPPPFTGTAPMLADDPSLGGLVQAGGYYTFNDSGGPPCPQPPVTGPPPFPAVAVQPVLFGTWSYSAGAWSTLDWGGPGGGYGWPPPYSSFAPYTCDWPTGPAAAMVLAGSFMLVGVAGTLGALFWKEREGSRPASRS